MTATGFRARWRAGARGPLIAPLLTLELAVGACAAPAIGPRGTEAMAHDKAHRTAAERKVDSHIVSAARAARETAPASPGSVPAPSAELEIDGRGNVHVDVQARITPGLEAAIVAAGGTVEASFPSYGTIRAWIPLSAAETLAARSDVTFIAPAARGTTNAPGPSIR